MSAPRAAAAHRTPRVTPAPLSTTYAEIVKGFNSRSSSVGSRQPSAQRVPLESPHTPAEEEYISSEICAPVCLESDVADEPSDAYSETVDASESDAYMPESNIYIQPEEKQWNTLETIENQDYQEQQIFESEVSEQIDQAPVHTELRPPEHHDRSLSPASKLRTQDLSYAEILALGLRKQATAHTIVPLPEPQVAQVEMVKEIIVEVEKAPPLIEYEPRIHSSESLRVKTDRFERPVQRSRSRDMPRQRRAPEKRSTKSHDTQIIKKKKISRRVIEVEDFDDTPEQQMLDSAPSCLDIHIPCQSIDQPSTETTYKELVKKVPQRLTVVETITVESLSDFTKTDSDQKKPKKKNKHKKPKDTDDEIEKALKEIEESDKQKRRKNKDSSEKSKEKLTKGTESDEAIDKNDDKIKPPDLKLDFKEGSIKQKKKKTSVKELQSSQITDLSSLAVARQNTNLKTITDIINEEMGNERSINDSAICSWELILEDISTNVKDKYKHEVTQHLIHNEKEANVTTETACLKKDNNDENINLSLEPELEITSKQRRKKKSKKQGKSVEEGHVDKNITDTMEKIHKETVQPIATSVQEVSNAKKMVEKPKQLDKTNDKANVSDVTLAQNIILDVTDATRNTKSKKQKSIEFKEPSILQTMSESLITNTEENKSIETCGEVEFTEAKVHKKKSKSKKPKIVDDEIEQALREIDQPISTKKKSVEISVKTKDKNQEFKQDVVKKETPKIMHDDGNIKIEDSNIISSDQEVGSSLITMDWNTLMAEEENIPESELAPISQSSIETDLSLESEQRATEVTILPEIIDLTNIETEGKDCLGKEQELETTRSIIHTQSISNEQNNNKTLRADNLIDSSFNIVEEITRYEPIIQDMETRTIYLITHEEKKLPPIRTVKVFNSKKNSLSADSQDKNESKTTTELITSEESNENMLELPVISSKLVTESSSLDLNPDTDLFPDNQHTNLVIDELSLIEKSESIPKDDAGEIIDEDIMYSADNDYKKNISDDKIQSNIEEYQYSGVEDFSENILEHAIFGSVQDRQRGQLKTSTIPYQELEEIKTYSLNLDFDRLDFDYYQLLDKQSNLSTKYEQDHVNDQIPEQDQADGEVIKNSAVIISSCEITEQSGFEEPQLNYEVIKSVDNPFTSYIETSKAEDMSLNETSQDKCDETEFKNRAENNKIEIPPTTYLEIVLDTQSHSTQTTTFENIPKFAGTNLTSEFVKEIKYNEVEILGKENDVLKSNDVTNIDIDVVDASKLLENEIPRFDYQEIADSERSLGIVCHKKTTPILESSVTNSDIKQVDLLKSHGLEELTKQSNTLIEVVLKEDTLSELVTENRDTEEENSSYLSLKRFNEDYSLHRIYHYIADAEKNYPGLVNMINQEQGDSSSSDVNIETIQNTQVFIEVDTVEETKTVAVTNKTNETGNPSDFNDNENVKLYSKGLLERKSNNMDVINFEKPKYDYHELSKGEILLASMLSTGQSKVKPTVTESQHDHTKIPTDDQVSVPIKNGNKQETNLQDLNRVDRQERTIPNNMSMPSYHEIRDAENRYGLNQSESIVDTELAPFVDESLDLVKKSESNVLLEALNQNLSEINLKQSFEESNKHIELKSETENIAKDPPIIHSQESQTLVYEPIIYNYSDLQDAERVFAQHAISMLYNNDKSLDCVSSTRTTQKPLEKLDDSCVTNKFDGKDDNELIIESKTEVFIDIGNSEKELTKTLETHEFNTLVPVVFGDVAMAASSILERETNKKQEQEEVKKQEVSDQNIEYTDQDKNEQIETTMKESIVEDFVVVDNLHLNLPDLEISAEKTEDSVLDSNPNIGDELDFEHSFEVIDLEKDVSFDVEEPIEINSNVEKFLIVEEQSTASDLGTASIGNVDVSSSTELPMEPKKHEVLNEEGLSEVSKYETMPHAISAKFIEAEIVQSVCSTTLITDTQQQVSNVMSTEPDKIIDNIIDHKIDSEQDSESKIENSNRPVKSPIHNLHDLLPEIDSIPEFKPSFTNTVLNSKLSADAPEFTPSYLYKTTDHTSSDCKQVNRQTSADSTFDEQVNLQTDMHQTNVTPITYSSILSSKKEQEICDINIDQKESEILSDFNKSEVSTEDKMETKSKRNKKQKQKDNKKEIPTIKDETSTIVTSIDEFSSVNVTETKHKPVSDQIENIWTKLTDDGKSYAEVLAEGLVGQEISSVHVIDNQDEYANATESILIEKIESPSDTEPLQCVEGDDSLETHDSWAKIVASNRPSPERIQKLVFPNEPIQSKSKAPIILVDESDSDHNKPDLEIDAEGFIKVDRNRRSRSKSRDDRSTSINRLLRQSDVREKSENRFNALTSTLKPDDGESTQSSHSDEEKEPIKKGRKSRSTKSKEKEVKPKVAQIAPSTSDEEKLPLKKDKKKRSSKSKEKVNKPLEVTEPSGSLAEIMEVETIVVQQKEEASVQPQQVLISETKKKSKKKKKEKKSFEDTTDTPSPVDITSSELETSEPTFTVPLKSVETPISTPESIETPIKDRFYAEAQYWKVDPSTVDALTNISEILTVKIDYDDDNKQENVVIEVQQAPESITVIETTKINNENLEVEHITKENNMGAFNPDDLPKTIEAQRISDEQSLENKMADLQREIEEMLLPENDASLASDVTPKELIDMQTSLDEQQEEILENITPSLASPEPEDTSETQITHKEAILTTECKEKSVQDIKTPDEDTKLIKDIQIKTPSLRDSLISAEASMLISNEGHIEGVNSITTNTSFIPSTNNLVDILQDNFWKEKALLDDAEILLVEQVIPKLDNFTSSQEKSDSDLKQIVNSKQTHSTDSDNMSNVLIEAPFWPEKHLYHDAECGYFLQIAKKHKHQIHFNTEVKNTDKKDKDKDPSGGSGHSSETDEPRESSGSPFDSNYLSMDLPGGICSWKDHSSYLSLETPSDSLTGLISEDTSKLGTDIPEDKLTTLSLVPVASLPPEQESPPQEDENRTTAKDDLSNNLETLLEEVRIVQAQLSDLPNETLDAMEAGLKEGIAVLIKCEEAAILLEQKIMEYGHESEVQSLLKELIIMKARISKLLEQARQGLHTIKDAKIEMESQFKRIEEQKEQVAKLDHWLDTINTELNVSTKQSEVLTEEDIIRYIEIYERYIRQYEEYEIILKSITVISVDESSQSMQMKLNALKKTLEESRVLVIAEIERLRQILINIKYTADVEEDVSQTDRTIDSTSMPEEIVSQKIIETVEVPSEHIKIVPEDDARFESEHVDVTIEEIKSPKIVESKITTTIETQTGKSLISEAPSVHDKSVICQPEVIETQDVSITCAPPKEVEVQTSEQKSEDGELLENIQVKQTTSDGHETIIISSRPVVREKAIDETSLLVDADYEGDNQIKNSELNITHSIPQSFETVMVEPDETTTEVVVDADGTKRIIVRKVRKTLVTRQQVLHTQERSSHVFSEFDAHRDHTFQQITLQEDQGSTSRTFDDGGIQNIQYQTYGGQVITGLPGREMTIQEFTSKPEMVISMGQDMNPDQILQIAEGKIQPEIQTSSSSVTAVVEQVTKRIIRTRRRIIRRVVIIDGKEHVSEEIIEEPDDVEVSEEQIPRVSINIMDRNIPIVKDDLDDDNKRPPDDRDPNLDDKKDSDIVEDKNKPLDLTKSTDDDAKSESHVIQEAKDDSVPEHDNSIQEHESISSQLLLSGNEVTQLETSSSHFATLTQKVTRTITRTKKRIIKHIQIIDGKEHVTEEVIEEPADVEIVELEPEETRVTLDEGTKMKRVKIIRQVQIIDGKEHVTEKIIDEGDDTSEPEISTGSNEEPSYHQEYVVSEPEQSQFTTGDNVADLTSSLIASEINYTLMSEQKGKRGLVEETVDDKKRDLLSTKQPTDTNEYATKLEIAEEVDKDSHKDISPESTHKRLLKPEESIQKDALPKTTELTSSDNETNDKMLKEQTHVDIPVVGIQDLPKESVILEQVSDVSVPEESVVSFGDKRWESTIGTSSTVTEEGFSTVTNRHVTRIRRRVIRRIQVIDGKEHITEEVIEEPEEVTIEPETFTIQEEGVKTRRIRIIRNVQIIDGKEHVTEQIVEDPDGEYVPDSTLTANVDVKIGPYEKSLLVTETEQNEGPIKDTLQNAEQKPQELPSSLEMTKGFIDREKEHTVSTVTIPSNQLSTKEDITEMTTQPQPDSENLAKEPKSKEIVSPSTDLETANSTIVQVEQNVDVHNTAHTRDLYVTDVLTPSDINIDSSVRTQEEDVLGKTQSVPQVITKTRDSEIDDVVPQLSEIATAAPAILPEDKKSEAEEVIIQDNQLEETQKNSLRDVTKSLIDSETSHVFELDSSKSIRIDKDLQAGSVEAKPKVEVGLPGETVSTTEASICSVIVKDVQNAPIKESLLEPSKSESKPVKNDNISNAESDIKSSILDATKSFLGMESEHSSINLKVTEIKTDQPLTQTSIPDDTNTDIINNVNETPVEIQSDDNKSIIISKDEVSQRDVEEILSPVDSKGTVDVDLPRQDVTNTLQDKNILIPKTEDTVLITKSESLISPKDEVEVFNEELDQKISSQIPVTKDSSVSGKDHNIIIRDNKDSEFVGCQIQERDGDIKCIKIIKQKVLIGDQEHSTEEIVEVPTDDSLPKLDLTTQIDLSISKTGLQEKVVSETSIDLIPVVSPIDTISVGNTIDFITSEAAHTSKLLNSQNDFTEKPRSIENLEKEVERPSKSADRAPEQSQIEVTDLKDITTATEKYLNEPIKVTISESDSIIIPTFKSEFDGVVNKDESTPKDTQILSHMTVDAGVSQTTVDITPIHTESPMTEVDIAVQPATSEVSYIKQFQPQETTRDEPQQTACDKYSEITSITIPVPDSKAEITKFIDLERHDTHLRDLMVTAPENKAIQTNVPKDDTHLSTAQTVDVFMSIEKNDNINQTVPSVQLDLKVESSDQEIPSIVKKDVDVILPADVKITKEPAKQQFVETEPVPEPLTQLPKASETPEEKEKVKKKPKKNKKQKRTSECSDSVEIDLHTETDRTINDTESSSLGHYVELPVSPHHDSPKPTESVVQTSILQEAELETSPVSTISVIEDKGYEPEDISLCPTPSPDKRKRGKRRKPQITSEITTYPKQQTTDEITIISSSVDTDDDFRQLKNTDSQEKDENDIMKYPEQEETKPLEKAELSEIISSETISNSPKEESCHTISDASDVSTVKIVEECVTGSPEMVRDKITTTVTYPVPVVEEIFTQEYSVQTSPETVPDLAVPDTEKVVAVPPTETADTNLQTSPTPVDEVFVQTLPKEDKEVHTQTISIETLNVQDSEIQTSRINTPDVITQSEAMTQVIPHDVSYLEEKNLQTSPITEFEENAVSEVSPIDFESIEIQTSPWPQIQKDEKGTETTVETIDTNVQTLQPQIVDQETFTSLENISELIESGVQTSDVITTSKFTQSDDASPVEQEYPGVRMDKELITLPLDHEEQKTITFDYSQQTSPTLMETLDHQSPIQIENIVKVDNAQQTSPRVNVEETTHISDKINTVLSDKTQQTTPRDYPEDVIADMKKDVSTTDRVQQTSPRVYSDDSISTSTDEPYEIHLRAQISIPQVTDDFINNERQIQEAPQSISGDKSKPKKRRHKKKTETSLHSPGSLSDPINAELSISVTPTSEDLSSRETTSIDEGISQITSPVVPPAQQFVAQPKLTYSDVVQRSKSKSPSPSKTIIPSMKSEKARLINSLEKRTQSMTEPQRNVSEDSLAVALIEPSMEKSYDLIINKELNELQTAIELIDNTKTEKSILIVIETISIWLEEIQYKIQIESVTQTKVSDKSERLKELQNHVQNLKEILFGTEVNEEVITLIETLTRQVEAVKNLSSNSSVKVKEVENEWGKFLEDTEMLSLSIERVKMRLDDMIILELSVQQKLDELDNVELENIDNTDTVRKLFRRFRSIVEVNPKRECPLKLYTCDEDTKQIENSINTERDRLMQLMSLAEEYEQTLQDFGHITDVAEALLDGKIIVSDLEHLHEEIQKHRKFFVNLSHCRAILESLEDNLDSETRAKFSSLHNSLHDRATKIIDRAAGRAQQMTLAASRWSVLDHGMKDEQQWLRVAHQRIPDLTNVTSMDHEQYINLYQSISLDVSHHYAKMLRLLSITESLQNLIVCSGLETECSIALSTLLTLQDDIDSRLTRLRAFKENWMTYEHLINRVESWMALANRELENITPDNITTTANLRRFWELKAQHEVHLNLKNESGVQFEKALEILPISDEMVQREFFMKIEDKWRELAASIGDLHATAIQNISDRDVSSGEKLHILEEELRELRASLDSLKGVIKSEDELNLYIERLQVMTGRIDRIQNELGRLSLLPTAESERLGVLLGQSGTLDDQIAEELERSMILKEKIVQVQAGILRCQKNQQRARLTLEECQAAEGLGSDVVERASETCRRLLDDLVAQWRDILALRQALHTLPISLRVTVSPTGVEKDISALQETHAELEAACNELCLRLRSRAALWRRFERQLELVQGAVREADYMAELLTVQGQVDYDRLLKATEKLETLSESLSRRSGELVGELREAAAPLEAGAEPAVAAQLRRDMDDAAAAYEHTCANLAQMCDKYQKAVELWRRYRDAASAVRAFAESQEGRLHALRPADAPAAAQACLEQEARVTELRSLAARVAAETGSRALQADADALARRLQLVAGAVRALADLGEARDLALAKAHHAKDKFCDMKQDLAPVHEESEIVEDKLIALRDNLIALGKSEADIAPAKAELPEIDRDVSEEHSIVRILELWQAMFRDTFLHYHRLSTALVRSGDAATALKLWHEYLLDLQSFLSGSVPTDYENLTEHRRLCRVHRNLLASQRSVLINENKETTNRELADKFDTLTNLHNETLARIVERHDEVCTRIAAWDDYREIYTELLRWLKEIEREKEKLQLRYVHIKRVHKILSKIQNLSDKLPEGRMFADKLSVYLKRVLVFTDDTYGASVRMEYAGIVKRVDNLQASLDTWRDFLTRILGLIGEYENLSGELHKLYSRTQDEIMSYSDDDRLSRPQIKKAIEKYTETRKKIDKTENQIEALSVIQEQLKECLSPQDIRIVNQKVWQMRQQRADLEHQLSIIIHRLQERLEVYTIFTSRITRFSEWMTTVESRLDTSSSSNDVSALDPQDLIRKINSDIHAETSLKEREFEWLSETGSTLVELSKKDEKSFSKNVSKQLKDVQDRWQRLQETGRSRIAKINELLETISQLEERLTEIRLKLHSIESKLTASVIIENLTTKAVDEKFQNCDEIHKSIEHESGEVGETLNLCELVFNDPDVLSGNFDLRNLRTGVDIVDKKWKNICEMSEHRKNSLKEIRKSAELANSLLPKVEKKLDGIEKRVEKVEIRKQRGDVEDDSVSKAAIKDLDALEEDVKRLEDAYSRIASTRGVELRGAAAEHAGRLRTAARRWRQLRARLAAAGTDLQRQFVAAHGSAVVALAEADVRLTRALHLAPTPTDHDATLKELDGVEAEIRECRALVAEADRLEAALAGAGGSAALAAEYRALLQDVTTRLDLARSSLLAGADVDSAVQVDTLTWETDAALQVDTLTSKETYSAELAAAVRETSDALEALRAALQYDLKEDASGDEMATAAKEIAKAGAKPGQTLELAKHLSELLLTECDATEDEAMLKEVESLSLRYEDLLTQAKKRELQINNLRLPHSASYALTCEHESGRLTCPLCSDRNWKQLDNDLWRLEQWLQFAEATDEARTDPPHNYDALEDAIQDHREFLLDLDSHKALVVSLNVVGAHVAQHAREPAAGERARARLAAANARWDAACARAAAWQTRLQHALVHNQQFHDIVEELVGQLSEAEACVRSREPLRLRRAPAELRADFRRFSELRDELARAEPRVQALRDAAALLHGADSQHVCRRLGELRLRLQSLRKLSAVYALKLGAALARHPAAGTTLAAAAAALAPQLLEEEEEQMSLGLPPLSAPQAPESEESEAQCVGRVQRGLRFVCRVARASLPFQALLLLLLGAAALAPHNTSPHACGPALALDPVLRYPDGPPPL